MSLIVPTAIERTKLRERRQAWTAGHHGATSRQRRTLFSVGRSTRSVARRIGQLDSFRRAVSSPASMRAPTPTAACGRRPLGLEATSTALPALKTILDRRRERRVESARHQLPSLLPASRPRGLGRAHVAGRRINWPTNTNTFRSAASRFTSRKVLYRGTQWVVFEPNDEPLVGADSPQRRRVHARIVPPGRVPGADAEGRLLRQMRQGDDAAGSDQPRHRQHRRRFRATQSRPNSSSSRFSKWPDRLKLKPGETYGSIQCQRPAVRSLQELQVPGQMGRQIRRGGQQSAARSSAPPRSSSTAKAATRAAAANPPAARNTRRSRSSAASRTTRNSSSGRTRSGTSAPDLGAEVSLKDFRKDIILEVYNEAGQLAIAYKVFRCWVSEFQSLADLDANANAVPSSTSSWKTRAGSGTSKCPSRVSRPSPTRRDLHMQYAPTATDLLNVWERGRSQSPVDRALSLLQIATREPPRGSACAVWHRPPRRGTAKAARKNFRIAHDRPRRLSRVWPANGNELYRGGSSDRASCQNFPKLALQIFGEYEISFRLPNSNDLATLVLDEDVATQKRRLVQRCVLNAKADGQLARGRSIAGERDRPCPNGCRELDPQGDVQLALTCPQCSHHWDAPLDIVSFVWSEIHAWAVRLLRDVHVLASSYGWREADILALSPWRRQAYLELIEQ